MRSDFQLAASLVSVASFTCKAAVDDASKWSVKCAQTSRICVAAMHRVLRSPTRLGIASRLLSWTHGMDTFITAVVRGEVVLDAGQPTNELLRARARAISEAAYGGERQGQAAAAPPQL